MIHTMQVTEKPFDEGQDKTDQPIPHTASSFDDTYHASDGEQSFVEGVDQMDQPPPHVLGSAL